MKVLTLIFLSVALANAKSIVCIGNMDQYQKRVGYTPGGITEIQLEGELVTDWIKDAQVKVTYENYNGLKVTEVGRAKELDSDSNYKPTKHKDHVKFNLENLTNVKDFSKFWPADTCEIEVMIPKTAMSLKRFSAPTQIHCDQSGGVTTLSCVTR